VAEHDRAAAQRIRREIVTWTERVAAHPQMGNPNRWPGFLTPGYPTRSKRIIYQVFEDRIEIAAFSDMRQDNSALKLRSASKDDR